MLEIDDLPEKEALFQFKDGLKDWTKIELNRRNVQTLDEAIATGETLVDYSSQSKGKKPSSEKHGGKHDKTKSFAHKDREKLRPSCGNMARMMVHTEVSPLNLLNLVLSVTDLIGSEIVQIERQ